MAKHSLVSSSWLAVKPLDLDVPGGAWPLLFFEEEEEEEEAFEEEVVDLVAARMGGGPAWVVVFLDDLDTALMAGGAPLGGAAPRGAPRGGAPLGGPAPRGAPRGAIPARPGGSDIIFYRNSG